MADFLTTYRKYIQPNEGYYSNQKGDIGGMTYGGVSRVYHPEWQGWKIVDVYISQKGGLSKMKNNERIPDADSSVTNFFQSLWRKYNMDSVNDQNVANIAFDWIVNSEGNAVKHIQKIVGVSQDGSLGANTVAAINKMNGAKLYNLIKADREAYYLSIAANDPTQEKFLAGWLDRLNKFPTVSVVGGTVLALAFITAIAVISLRNS
jgi:lysozyme family protein